jgi:hypothetical protein
LCSKKRFTGGIKTWKNVEFFKFLI